MQIIKAIVTIIRLPNLVFIFLTQLFAYYFIILPALHSTSQQATFNDFYIVLLSLSTVLIAAAGYIINDYFDIGIDAINKPNKVTIEKIFKRRTIIIWHIVFNIIGIAIAAYIAFYFVQLRYIIIQIISILLLLFYSTTFKRKLIIGNVTIACLTSLTLLTMAFYEPNFRLFDLQFAHSKLLWMYVLFAFLITLIREIIKDIEDVKGDTAQHCETIPLVLGIQTAKNICYVLIIFLEILIVVISIYFFQFNLFLVMFLAVFVSLPLILVSQKIVIAANSIDFHKISTYIKLVTLFGILSMVFI